DDEALAVRRGFYCLPAVELADVFEEGRFQRINRVDNQRLISVRVGIELAEHDKNIIEGIHVFDSVDGDALRQAPLQKQGDRFRRLAGERCLPPALMSVNQNDWGGAG